MYTYYIMSKISMTMEEIEFRLPELCADSPFAKYHIYATINELCEDDKIELDNTINAIKFKESIINKHYKEKCVINANFDKDGNLIS